MIDHVEDKENKTDHQSDSNQSQGVAGRKSSESNRYVRKKLLYVVLH